METDLWVSILYVCIKALQRACQAAVAAGADVIIGKTGASHESAEVCQQNLPDKDSSDCIPRSVQPS